MEKIIKSKSPFGSPVVEYFHTIVLLLLLSTTFTTEYQLHRLRDEYSRKGREHEKEGWDERREEGASEDRERCYLYCV